MCDFTLICQAFSLTASSFASHKTEPRGFFQACFLFHQPSQQSISISCDHHHQRSRCVSACQSALTRALHHRPPASTVTLTQSTSRLSVVRFPLVWVPVLSPTSLLSALRNRPLRATLLFALLRPLVPPARLSIRLVSLCNTSDMT